MLSFILHSTQFYSYFVFEKQQVKLFTVSQTGPIFNGAFVIGLIALVYTINKDSDLNSLAEIELNDKLEQEFNSFFTQHRVTISQNQIFQKRFYIIKPKINRELTEQMIFEFERICKKANSKKGGFKVGSLAFKLEMFIRNTKQLRRQISIRHSGHDGIFRETELFNSNCVSLTINNDTRERYSH